MHRKHVDDMSYVQKLLSSDFSEAFRLWKNGVRLYRSSADNGMVDLATPFFRTSAGTGNEYTLLISEILPSWRNYPKRNYCIICAGNRSSAKEYQEPGRAIYCVLPKNGASIAIAPTADMWYSFSILRKYEIDTLDDFNRKLVSFLSSASGMPQNAIEQIFQDSDVPAVLQLFKDIEADAKTLKRTSLPKFEDFLVSGLNIGEPLAMLLDRLLSPDANGFSVCRISEVAEVKTEAWTSSDCLFLDEKMLAQFLS